MVGFAEGSYFVAMVGIIDSDGSRFATGLGLGWLDLNRWLVFLFRGV